MGFRTKKNYETADGHRYVSVPTTVPVKWARAYDEHGKLCYGSGEYQIVREPYGSRHTYTVYRDGEELSLSWTSSLRDAKARAVINARGNDVFNWA